MKTATEKRILATGVYTPDANEALMNPQIMLVNEKDWVVIAPNLRMSGLIQTLSMEDFDCPVVLTTDIKDKGLLNRLIKNFVTIEGVHDLDLFIYRLEQIGGIVSYPTSVIN